MNRAILLLLLLLPLLVQAQLKEFEAEPLQRNENVIQGNRDFPDNVLILVYSSLDYLQFRSSLDVINRQSYNAQLSRYEILAEPRKQMINVSAPGFMQLLIATINPNPKDVLYYKVEEKKTEVVSTEPGTLRIITEPSGADVIINGIKASDKTPFTGELLAQTYSLTLRKQDFNPFDTLMSVQSGQRVLLDLKLTKQQGRFSISSTPAGAQVFLNGHYKGITPLQGSVDVGHYEVEVRLEGYTITKQSIQLEHNLVAQKSFSLTANPTFDTSVNNSKIFVSPTKMNVLYRGVKNPISISVPGVAPQNLIAIMEGGSLSPDISSGSGNYIIETSGRIEAKVLVSAMIDGKIQTLGSFIFRIKNVPDPIGTIAGVSGGLVSANRLTAAPTVIPKMVNFDFELFFKTTSFDIVYQVGTSLITKNISGGSIPPDALDQVRRLTKGSRVFIENISAVMLDRNNQPVAGIPPFHLSPISLRIE